MFGRAEKLLMEIRALKWQATTMLSSPPKGVTRRDVEAFVKELDALETSARKPMTEDVLSAGEQQVAALGLRVLNFRPR